MTFDREPDLDNANVGMPDDRRMFAETANLGLRFFSLFSRAPSIHQEEKI